MKRRIVTTVLLFLAMSGLASQAIAAADEPGGADGTQNSIFMTYN